MELQPYLSPLLRWWWLLALSTALAAISSFLAVRQQPVVYQASATLMIGRLIEDPNPNAGEFGLAQQLASTYADIGNREPVKARTMEALGLPFLPVTFVRPLPNSSLIEVTVTDSDPQRAQLVANELAQQLILSSPGGASSDADRRQFIDEQLNLLQSQIDNTNLELEKLQRELGDLNSARQIADTQAEIAALQNKLSVLQANFASLLASLPQGATNTLSLIEPAGLPISPVGPRTPTITGLAAAIGLGLAILAAYALEALDDTLKTADEIGRLVDAPILGHIGVINHKTDGGIYIADHPDSIVAEGFRALRTNLEFEAVNHPLQTLMVTSACAGDGKTFIACNLAVMMAQAGKRVVIVDADLRNPGVHQSFRLVNTRGLSDVFLGSVSVASTIIDGAEAKVGVVTAGTPPPNPTELISSKKMDEILNNLQELADVVILDTAPFLVADAWALAAKVDAVLLVLRPGYTQKNAVRSMLEQIKRSGARVAGITLNHVRRQPQQYYGGSLASSYGVRATRVSSTRTGRPPRESKADVGLN